jgi:hypothetical protein
MRQRLQQVLFAHARLGGDFRQGLLADGLTNLLGLDRLVCALAHPGINSLAMAGVAELLKQTAEAAQQTARSGAARKRASKTASKTAARRRAALLAAAQKAAEQTAKAALARIRRGNGRILVGEHVLQQQSANGDDRRLRHAFRKQAAQAAGVAVIEKAH